jgi:hypothetical protein
MEFQTSQVELAPPSPLVDENHHVKVSPVLEHQKGEVKVRGFGISVVRALEKEMGEEKSGEEERVDVNSFLMPSVMEVQEFLILGQEKSTLQDQVSADVDPCLMEAQESAVVEAPETDTADVLEPSALCAQAMFNAHTILMRWRPKKKFSGIWRKWMLSPTC